MVGANDELVRELRWRGADVAPRATPLGRFFDVRGRTAQPPRDIGAVAQWSAGSALGAHLPTAALSGLVVRGGVRGPGEPDRPPSAAERRRPA